MGEVCKSTDGQLSAILFGTCENDSTSSLADCFSGAKRDLDSVRDWGEARAGRRNQMVRGRRPRRQLAEVGRLLAHGIRG